MAVKQIELAKICTNIWERHRLEHGIPVVPEMCVDDRKVYYSRTDEKGEFSFTEPSAFEDRFFVTFFRMGFIYGPKDSVPRDDVAAVLDVLEFDWTKARRTEQLFTGPLLFTNPSREKYVPPGHVYFVQQVGGVGPIKIGYETTSGTRLGSLQTGSPVKLCVLARIGGASRKTEENLHQRFSRDRQHGEWFSPSSRLLKFIDEVKNGVRNAGNITE